MEDWFRWLLGLIAAAALGASAWLYKLAHDLDKRVTVLEQRPQLDLIAHTEAMTRMAIAIEHMNEALGAHVRSLAELDQKFDKWMEDRRRGLIR